MVKVPSPLKSLTDADPFPEDCARKFDFLRKIASGGFGAVFLAKDKRLDRPVAIKLLLADVLKEQEQVDRFNQEARITASLSHPNIIQIFDFGASTGTPWIAYEYVDGKSVREILDASRGGLPVDKAIQIATQVAA